MIQAKEILRIYSYGIVRNESTEEYDLIAAMQEHTDLQTAALQEENRQLKERADKLADAVARIKSIADQYYQTLKNPSANHLSLIASEALTAYQQEQTNKTT
jgi:hypothetical protein